MRLKEFFLGMPEETVAKQTVASLDKPNLRVRDQRDYNALGH